MQMYLSQSFYIEQYFLPCCKLSHLCYRIGKHKKTEEPAQTLDDDKDSLKEAELQFKVREENIRAHQKEQERYFIKHWILLFSLLLRKFV